MSVTADKNQRYIMLALPFVFVFFIKSFPAGLLVYWITTNLWTVGQQYFIRRSTGQLPPWMPGSGGQPPATPVLAGAGAAAIAAPTPRAGKGSAKADPPAAPAAAPPPSPKRKKKKTGRRR
jgi:YidC/Oxa1 family membrane protein insertase